MKKNILKIKKKEEELIKLANMTEKEVENLDFKGKQKHYAAKCKLGKIVHISRNKDGKGITYRKIKEVK